MFPSGTKVYYKWSMVKCDDQSVYFLQSQSELYRAPAYLQKLVMQRKFAKKMLIQVNLALLTTVTVEHQNVQDEDGDD